MHYLSICAIFRMENSWLDEWIRYHRAVGVEHFSLFNDDPDPCVSDRILKPYVDRGIVENIHVSDASDRIRGDAEHRQNDAYREAIRNSIGKTMWLGNNPVCDREYFDFHDRNEIFDDEISRRFGKNVEGSIFENREPS